MTRYLITRHGSNGANQSRCQRMVLGSVVVEGKTKAQREAALLARVGSSLPGTIDATTTFAGDNGEVWHAYHNQQFCWRLWSRTRREDRDACGDSL